MTEEKDILAVGFFTETAKKKTTPNPTPLLKAHHLVVESESDKGFIYTWICIGFVNWISSNRAGFKLTQLIT